MGLLKKLFRGVKKVFSKIGKGIKKVVKKVGKFVNKLGIVGQIGLMFAIPAIGGWLMSSAPGWIGSLTQAGASALSKGVGTVLKGAYNFAKTVGNVYSTVTGAVTDFIGTAGKYIGGKLGVKVGGKKLANMTLGEAWTTYTDSVMKNVSNIFEGTSPWKLKEIDLESLPEKLPDLVTPQSEPFVGPPDPLSEEAYNPRLLTEEQMSYTASTGPSPSLMDRPDTGRPSLPEIEPIEIEQGTMDAPSFEVDMPAPEINVGVDPNIPGGVSTPTQILTESKENLETWKDRVWGYAKNYPERVARQIGQAIDAAPVTYAMQKMNQDDMNDYYASLEAIQEQAVSSVAPIYEPTPSVGLAASTPLETVGWEYYTGASNQRLGGSMTDPSGTYGYSAYQETLRRAMA
jgi:hypothetical protein